ncbi:3-hydroxyacyl-CoA dehydrogenase [Oceanobacillus polygoni]|uniref:3-hydroxyacyl-CoA dehydrogenase n=1 Tax=Oceanobacillus polygoni TaxID=1235259 RepID=A0A9X0YN61_9BACI|nr:3-hydroxyacyl-CoA dehydrogenase [Oceanobacillus polygoni]
MSQNWYWQSALAREAMSLVENRIASPADVDTI